MTADGSLSTGYHPRRQRCGEDELDEPIRKRPTRSKLPWAPPALQRSDMLESRSYDWRETANCRSTRSSAPATKPPSEPTSWPARYSSMTDKLRCRWATSRDSSDRGDQVLTGRWE